MHALIMLLEGGKRLSFAERSIEIGSGDLLLLQQGNYFMSDILSQNGKYEAILVYFDDAFVLDFIRKYNLSFVGTSPRKAITFKANTFLHELIRTYPTYKGEKRVNQLLRLKTEEIFLHLLSAYEERFKRFLYAVQTSSKERLKYLLEDNLDIIESVEDICKLARISEYELRRQMRKLFHLSPKKWLLQQRLKEAALLLKKSDKSISQIAAECRFSTASWFGVQFKKEFGMTPGAYREENR